MASNLVRTGHFTVGSPGRILVSSSAPLSEDYMLTTVDITNAQLLTIHTSPVQVVDPGAGKVAWPLAGFFMVKPGTKQWNGGIDILLSTAPLASQGFCWIDFGCNWTGGHIGGFVASPMAPDGSTFNPTDVVGQPLVLTVSGFSTPVPPAGGDAGAICVVAYEVVDPNA